MLIGTEAADALRLVQAQPLDSPDADAARPEVTICCGQGAGRLREVYAQAVVRAGYPVGPSSDLDHEGAVAMGLYAIAASIAKHGIKAPASSTPPLAAAAAAAAAPAAVERKPWDAAPEEFGFQSSAPPVAVAPPSPMTAPAPVERKPWDAAPEEFGFQSTAPPVAVAPPPRTGAAAPPAAPAPAPVVDYSQYYSNQSQEMLAKNAPPPAPTPEAPPAVVESEPTLYDDESFFASAAEAAASPTQTPAPAPAPTLYVSPALAPAPSPAPAPTLYVSPAPAPAPAPAEDPFAAAFSFGGPGGDQDDAGFFASAAVRILCQPRLGSCWQRRR